MLRRPTKSKGLLAAIEAAGSQKALAKRLRLHPSAVSQWKDVPLKRLPRIRKVTGLSVQVLRPDLFD